jgi:hypothetical protein
MVPWPAGRFGNDPMVVNDDRWAGITGPFGLSMVKNLLLGPLVLVVGKVAVAV